MLDGIQGSNALGVEGLAQTLGGANQALDRDAFLKLLVEQLRNQDPLEPQQNSEFVAQLAQFSSLEQSIGINDRLDALTLTSQGQANTQVVGLVGKMATVRGNLATIDGSGGAIPVRFSLQAAANQISAQIRNQNGTVVRTLEVPPAGAGAVSVSWDGRGNNGLLQPAGAYSIVVEASNNDSPVAVTQESSGQVNAVSFDRGFPVIHLSSGLTVPVSELLRVEPAPEPPSSL